jgi:K(+)-stimulated pyrophosphate-energized sodium pump
MDKLIYLVPLMGIIGLLYTFIQFRWVSAQEEGTDLMKQISRYIAEGAMAFLKAEWKILGYFVVIVALLLGFMASTNPDSHWSISIAFILGAILSATAGYIGMRVATKANVRTAHAAGPASVGPSKFPYRRSIMGLGIAGLAVLGLGGLFIILKAIFAPTAAVIQKKCCVPLRCLQVFHWVPNPLHFCPRRRQVFIPKRLMWVLTLLGK